MTRCQRVIEDRYLVFGTWYLDKSGSGAGVGDAIVESKKPFRQDPEGLSDVRTRLDDFEPRGELELAVNLGYRAQSDPYESGQFSWTAAPCSFGDVRSDRHGSRPQLRREPKSFLCRKISSQLIDLRSQDQAVLPHLEPAKVVHAEISTEARRRFTPLRSKYQIPGTRYRLFIGLAR